MKRLLSVIAVLLSSFMAIAQSGLEGTWHGRLSFPGGELTLVFHIDPENSTFDSPDQMAFGLEAEIKELNGSKVSVEVPSIGVKFEGNLMLGLLVGRFSQAGLELPLSLKRGEPQRNRPQTPKPPYPYLTEEVTFTNPEDGTVLSGTLSIPQDAGKDTPAVLLVSGSGLQDRNEEIFAHKPFHVIADHFARNGIATLRYDDRSVGKSSGEAAGATTETFMRDAEAGLDFLKSLDRFGNIGLAGHSEGGLIGFILAGRGLTDFIISLAGPAVKGSDCIIGQNRKILEASGVPVTTAAAYCRVLEEIYGNPGLTKERLGELSVAVPESMRKNLENIYEADDPWINHFVSFDPAEHISKITCPVMAVNGGKDMQVIADSNIGRLEALLKESGGNLLKTYPELNHMFQHCTTGLPDEYGKIEETISEEVLQDMTTWINSL